MDEEFQKRLVEHKEAAVTRTEKKRAKRLVLLLLLLLLLLLSTFIEHTFAGCHKCAVGVGTGCHRKMNLLENWFYLLAQPKYVERFSVVNFFFFSL